MNFFAKNIDYLVHKHRLKSPTALAEKLKISQPSLNRAYNGRVSDPRSATIEPIAKLANATIDELKNVDLEKRDQARDIWGSWGGPPTLEARNEGPSVAESGVRAQSGTLYQPLLAWDYDDDLPPGDYVFIPRMEVRLAAGEGYEQTKFEVSKAKPQIFDADWIRAERLKPSSLAVMKADGDSMEPRIQHGDSLVIDFSQTSVVDGRVYALFYPGGERVKRLTRTPSGGLIIASDNRAHQTITLNAEEAEHVRIIGRVVNTSGTRGL